MSRDDWFRNTTWNESIAVAFETKLRRARQKEQYLRIQAHSLAESCPEVALELFARYFALPDQFDHATACVGRATALVALGRVDEAIAAYEDALAREAAFPNLRTNAWLELALLIATRQSRSHYARARDLLARRESSERHMLFPRQVFQWHAAHALIAADCDDPDGAIAHADQALDAAGLQRTELRYHPHVGLVTERDADVVERLRALRTH